MSDCETVCQTDRQTTLYDELTQENSKRRNEMDRNETQWTEDKTEAQKKLTDILEILSDGVMTTQELANRRYVIYDLAMALRIAIMDDKG